MNEYRLVRMKRRSVSLSLDKDGVPLIKAPYNASSEMIDKFYHEKYDWVKAQQKLFYERQSKRSAALGSDVDSLTLFGREYPVTHEPRPYGFDWKSFNLPNGSFGELKPYIIGMYKNIAAADIKRRVREFAPKVGVSPSAVKINSASTRWGSCSGKASLNFSWKLILAPDDVIDYVVVHELCHILYMDHSPLFWAEVARVIPDWKQKRGKLRDVQKVIGDNAWD